MGRLCPPGGSVENLPDSGRLPGVETGMVVVAFGVAGLPAAAVDELVFCAAWTLASLRGSLVGKACLGMLSPFVSGCPFEAFCPLLSLTSPSSSSAVAVFRGGKLGVNSVAEARRAEFVGTAGDFCSSLESLDYGLSAFTF